MTVSRPLTFAMIGGGEGSQIGPLHRKGAEGAGIQLVAGAFASSAERCLTTATKLGIATDRAYPDHQALLAAEAGRADRVDFIVIATPNHLHFPIASAAIEAGFAVLSDKPATATLEEAVRLAEIVAAKRAAYGLTYTYAGYPMIRLMRRLCRDGVVGQVRRVHVEYFQGWLADPIETTGSAQAAWRTDPAQSGVGGCIADIGVHAFHACEFVTGNRVTAVNADLGSIVEGRRLDDDASVFLRLGDNVRGVLTTSQVATGVSKGLRLRVWGTEGGLDWALADPHVLRRTARDGATEVLTATGSEGQKFSEPSADPAGFSEAFAQLYRDFAKRVRGTEDDPALLPGIDEGLRSVRFVDSCVKNSRAGGGWSLFAAI